jgi:uncharacterized membrane protein
MFSELKKTLVNGGGMQFIPWIFLIAQAGIVVASLLGYGIFTSRPDLLVQVDPQARFFTWAFYGFAVGNMLFGGLAVVAESMLRERRRAIVAFVAVYIVSLTSELLGTTYGVPFGSYSYTTLLGPKWFDRVPLLIPLELVHDELGSLDYRVPQKTWISGGAIGSMPFSRLGLVAGSSHEQSH